MVGEEEVQEFVDINNLQESAGAFAALNAKANFQGCPHFFDDPIHVRRALIAKREAAGADTPLGHTCSNIVEQLENLFGYVRPAWATHETQTLPYQINKQIERLERLSGHQ